MSEVAVRIVIGNQSVTLSRAEAEHVRELLRHVDAGGGEVCLVLDGVHHEMSARDAVALRKNVNAALEGLA